MDLTASLTSSPSAVAQRLRATITRLAAIDRSSCSPGEHEAADWIAGALGELGAEAEVERYRVHGSYWWPLGLTSAGGLAAAQLGRGGRRWPGGLLGLLSCVLVLDELGARRRWLRRVLPKQVTADVVGVLGDSDAERTLIIVSHHDAAHTGVFFNPRIAEFMTRNGPNRGSPHPLAGPMLPVAAGPALGALAALTGSRKLGALARLLCGGIILSLAHIARSPTVPGANDNLSGVATLLEVGRSLADRPVSGLRVLLVSTGAEESMMEGMRAFADRHLSVLARESTRVLCVDAVGSSHLVLVEAEGMLEVFPYDRALKELVAERAAELDIDLIRGFTMRLGTDGYIALRHGVPAACLMSVNDNGLGSNYHWPTDTPERVEYRTVEEAVRLCQEVVRALAASG